MRDRRPGTRAAAAAGIGAAVLILAAGCGPGGPGRPDVILVVVDTLRADHLGAYGYDRATSPAIDALGRRGTLFEDAWAAAPWTLPSVMSIMTSRYPSSHRVENDGLRLSPGIPTLAETLQARGYATGAFVSHVYVGRNFGFERGFEAFEDFGISSPGYRPEARMEPTADRVTDAALAWARSQGRRPVFLFVHYFDPHWPYDPPEPYRALFPNAYAGPLDAGYDSISRFQDPGAAIPADYRRFLIDRYDGEIRFVDDQLARLIEGLGALGRSGRAWIVLTGDHGEEFKDHGSMGHGRQLYEEVIRVPLIVVAPGSGADGAQPAPGARRVSAPVSGVDLLPTILDLLEAGPPPAGAQGRSIAPLLRPQVGGERGPAADRPLVSETVRLNAYRKAVRIRDLKLIHFLDENRSELYDLAADPRERRDLSEAKPEERRRLARALFSEVDLLSGGWNLRWRSDDKKRRFEGRITTDGIFRTVVPMFADRGKYRIERGNALSFTDDRQASDTGISFTTAPYEANVTFELMIDGVASAEWVSLGGERVRPRGMPFTLAGDAKSDAAFVRPQPGPGFGYDLWRNRPPGADQTIILDEEIRRRLKSLGYVD